MQNNISLLEAIKARDIVAAKTLIEQKIGINSVDNYQLTPLHLVLRSGNKKLLELVELLIKNGADVNARDSQEKTPLHYLPRSYYGDKQADEKSTALAEILIKNGADVNAKCKDTYATTVLESAVAFQRYELLALLIKNGADVNIKNQYGESILYRTIGNIKLFKFLVENGADVNLQYHNNNTILHFIRPYDSELISILIGSGADVNARNNLGQTPLHLAVSRGYKDIAVILIGSGADVNARNKQEQTPLHLAISNGYEEIATLLIEEGSDVNARNNQEQTPLHLAVSSGRTDLVTLLIENGADVNARNNQEQTLLHLAVSSGHTELVTLLMNGADVNARNKQEQTPLHLAVSSGHIGLATLLIENGADVNAKSLDNDGTPLHLAISKSHLELVTLLIEKGADDHCFELAIQRGNLKVVELLLKSTAFSFTAKDIYSLAKRSGLDEVLVKLEQYINTSLKESLLQDLLQLALSNGNTDIVEQLCNKGAVIKDSIVGFSNPRGQWSGPIVDIAKHNREKNSDVYALPIKKSHVDNEQFISQFSGFISPGAGDNFPSDREFALSDLSPESMIENEILYQAVLNIVNKYHMPYIGICSGSQHLILNHEGHLNSVDGYVGGDHQVEFIAGTFSHFLTLTFAEQNDALAKCIMPEVKFPISTAHHYAGVKENLGAVKLGAVSEDGVVEATSFGASQIGFQFHPENFYFQSDEGVNRNKNIWDNFFGLTQQYRQTLSFCKSNGIGLNKTLDGISTADNLILSRLAECVADPLAAANEDNFFGNLTDTNYTARLSSFVEDLLLVEEVQTAGDIEPAIAEHSI